MRRKQLYQKREQQQTFVKEAYEKRLIHSFERHRAREVTHDNAKNQVQ